MNAAIRRRIGVLLLVVVPTWLMIGCGPEHTVIEDSTLHESNSGHLTIYRPDTYFHKFHPEEPHVYIDDRRVKTLGVGERILVRLPPGEHQIVVRDSLLGIPTYMVGTVRLGVEAGGEYYVRYSYDMSGFGMLPGSVAYPLGESSLRIVTPQEARNEGQ